MEELIRTSFAFVGLCFVLRYGSILEKPRKFLSQVDFFKKLFNCSLCLGWHVGFWGALLYLGEGLIESFVWGFYSAAISWIADHFIMGVRKWTESS